MAVVPTSFQAAYPEFSTASTVNIQAALTRAELRIGTTTQLGTTEAIRDELVSLLAAHFLSLSSRSSLSLGSAAAEVIDIDDSYRVEFTKNRDLLGLQTTSYGQEYELLRKQIIVPFRII